MKKMLLLFTMLFAMAIASAVAGDVKLVDKDELKGLLGSKGLVILDVRAGRDWSTSEFKIQGAVRADAADFDSWSKSYPKDARLILYCA
jgi:rhodanese-related sulfurtransferase